MGKHRRWLAVCVMVGCLAFASFLAATSLQRQAPPATPVPSMSKARVLETFGKLPLVFEKNLGQSDPRVKFIARTGGFTLFLTDRDAVLRLSTPATSEEAGRASSPAAQAHAPRVQSIVRLTLPGAQTSGQAEGFEPQPGYANYLIGKDASRWVRNVPLYGRVRYRNVYPGIDAVYYGNQNRLETDYVVAPGSDPSRIALGIDGAKSLNLNSHGDLEIASAAGNLLLRRPNVYQEINGARREVAANYVRRDSQSFGIEVAAYDTRSALIIDPVIVYSTYLGGATANSGNALSFALGVAVDPAGNAYVTGGTDTTDFPTTSSVYQSSNNANGFEFNNIFVTKLNPTGTALVYSTFLGGHGSDNATGIGIDSSGNAYVAGQTTSIDFPVTAGTAIQSIAPLKNNFGSANAFFAELDPNGANLLYSTYLGGNGTDTASGIALAVSPATTRLNAYIAGTTSSTNFPIAGNPLQSVNNTSGGQNIFLSVIDPSQVGTSALVYSTYLGGSSGASASGIAADAAGNAYIAGAAGSDFPTTANAFQASSGGAAFMARVDTVSSALVYSSFIGESSPSAETANSIAADSNFNAYICGHTYDESFPVTPGAFETAFPGNPGIGTGFVARFDTSHSGTASLVYATYLGGNISGDQPHAIAIDSAGNAYLTGETWSGNFPVTPGAPQPTGHGGLQNGFVFVLSADGSKDLFSTYYGTGGAGTSLNSAAGLAIALDTAVTPDVFIVGATSSATFPVTAGSFQTTLKGLQDAFVAKLSPAAAQGVFATPSSLNFGNQPKGTTSASQVVTLANNTQSALGNIVISVTGTNAADFGQTSNCPVSPATLAAGATCTINVTFTPSTTSSESATLNIADSDASSPQTVALSGTGTTPPPGVTLTPSPVSFGSVAQGSNTQQGVTLLNNSGAALTISSISFTGTNASDFTQMNNCPMSPATLAAGTSCTITVTFAPTATGNETATLQVTDSDASSPQTDALSGTGTTPPGTVSVSPGSINFGNVNLNTTSAAQTATLTNGKTITLTINSISIAGANASDFSQTNTCGASLAANTNCTISVKFTPSTTTAESATLSISDSDATSPQNVSLSGTGVAVGPDFTISANPSSATLTTPGSITTTITVTSVSGFTSPVTLACPSAPAGVACAFSQNPLTPPANGSATATLTISDGIAGLIRPVPPAPPMNLRFPVWAWLFAAVLFAGLGMWKAPDRRLRQAACALALLALVGLASCTGTPGAPSGTFSVNVTGQSGVSTHTFRFSLTLN